MIPQLQIISALSRGPIEVDDEAGVLIPNVKFPTAFSLGAIEGAGKTYKTKYLTERWNWFNKELFGGVMKLPNFEITKNFKDIKLFGSYTPGVRVMKMHPKLWSLKTEAQCLGTLVHEMAHQYETEHDRRQPGEDGHGPKWQSIMRAIGMPTDAKYTGDAETLKNFKERQVTDQFQRTNKKAKPSDFPKIANYAVFVNKVKGREVPVVIVGPGEKTVVGPTTGGYIFVPGFTEKDLADGYARNFVLSYLYIPDALQLGQFPKALLSTEAIQKAARLSAKHDDKDKMRGGDDNSDA